MSYTEQLWFGFSSFVYAGQYDMIELVSIFEKTLVSVGLRWVRAVHKHYSMISGMGQWIDTTVARHIFCQIASTMVQDQIRPAAEHNNKKSLPHVCLYPIQHLFRAALLFGTNSLPKKRTPWWHTKYLHSFLFIKFDPTWLQPRHQLLSNNLDGNNE